MATLRSLLDYRFDTRTGQYRQPNGRFIRPSTINELIRDRIELSQTRLVDLYRASQQPGNGFTPDDFREAAAVELRNLHIQLAIVGRGGRDSMTPSDWGALGTKLRREYGFLNLFLQEIADGRLSDLQIIARLNMYANKAHNSHWAAKTAQGKTIHTQERRVLSPAENCPDCVGLAALGWQPIGTLPDPGNGDTVCLSNCQCTKEYK